MKRARSLFLIARVHGLKAHLVTRQDFLHLLGSAGLAGMNDLLLKSDYSTELSRVPAEELTASRLEKLFLEKLSKRWFSLLQAVSGKMLKLLEAYEARFETENLKKVIRAIHGNGNVSEEQLIDIPRKYQRVNVSALLLAKTVDEVAGLLQESPYKFSKEQLASYERYENPLLLETQLDKTYFETLWNETSRMPNAAKTRTMFGIEADLSNLKLIVKSKYINLEPQFARQAMIDLRSRLGKNEAYNLTNATIQEIPKLVTWLSYSDLLQKAVGLIEEKRIAEMENLFSLYWYSDVEKTLIRNPNDLVYVFCYLQLCVREARNLTSLAIGKQMKLSQDRLRDLLQL